MSISEIILQQRSKEETFQLRMSKYLTNVLVYEYEDASGPCMPPVVRGVRVAYSLLLLYIYYPGYFMFFVVCVCFPCLVVIPVLHSFPWNLGSLDYSWTKLTVGTHKPRLNII